jgi:hypothetical protein
VWAFIGLGYYLNDWTNAVGVTEIVEADVVYGRVSGDVGERRRRGDAIACAVR